MAEPSDNSSAGTGRSHILDAQEDVGSNTVQLAHRQPSEVYNFETIAAPWDSEQVCGNLGQHHMELVNERPYMPIDPNTYYSRSSPKSAMSGDTVSRDRLDSDYGSKSVRNILHSQTDERQGIAGEVRGFHLYPDSSDYSHNASYVHVDMFGEDKPETSFIYPVKCTHPGCKKESKNYSDYKYMSPYTSN